MRCDLCDKEVTGRLSASRRGRWGMNLCHTCWMRLRKRELAEQGQPPTMAQRAEAAKADGPPYPWPACELCGEDVNQHGLGYWTTKGRPRRFCSLECRQSNNSREGTPIRTALTRERIKAGTWENPVNFTTPEQRREYGKLGGEVRAETLRAEVEAGTWQNPADAPGAREKLSRPRKYADNPVLHSAIEKLGQGYSVSDLTSEEAEAHRQYRRKLGKRMRQGPPNPAFREARERAGLSQAEIARRLGVSSNTVHFWESHSVMPGPENRAGVVELLGCDPWAE